MSLLLALVLSANAPTIVNSRIVSASIFRAGLALVTREVNVPAGRATYSLDIVPEAIDGGFWYGSPDGAKVRDVTTKLEWVDKTIEFQPKTIGDYMAANVGKRLKIALPSGKPGEVEWLDALLTRMDDPPYGMAFFKLDNNHLRLVNPGAVTEIDLTGLAQIWKRQTKVSNVHIDFEVDASKPSRVRWTTLEFGPAWSPSYLLELYPGKEAELTAKVQLGLPGWKFEQTDVQLLAGKPVVSTDWAADLASAQGTIENFINRAGPQWRNDAKDPFENFGQQQQQLQSYIGNNYQGGYGGGGFGGGGFGQGGGYEGRAYQDTRSTDVFAREPEINRTGSVFAYPMGKLDLKAGERLTRVMFASTAKVERIVEWRLGLHQGISDQIEVENTGKLPWTGGRCTVLNNGTPLAILSLPFTTVGGKAVLSMGAAPDLRYKSTIENTVGETIKTKNSFQALTTWHTVTLRFENTRDEPIVVRVIFSERCMEMEATGAEITTGADSSLYAQERKATYRQTIKAGESLEYRIRYRTLGQ